MCVKGPQMDGYAKNFDKNSKCMNLLINNKEILEKYSEIWNKIKSLLKKEFNSEPVYNEKPIKTKMNFTITRCIKIFNIIKYQKIMNIVHVYL